MNNKRLSFYYKKCGVILPLVAAGILAIAGLVPFLLSNTETNQKLSQSLDEANKITWALESAAKEKLNKDNSGEALGIGSKTLFETADTNPTTFRYGAATSTTFLAKASVVQYNSFLNKNSAIVARGDRNGKQDLTQ